MHFFALRFSPTSHPTIKPSFIPTKVPIASSKSSSGSSKTLNDGQVAGIVIGVLAAIALAFLGYTYVSRMQKANDGNFSGNVDNQQDQFQPVGNPLVINHMVCNMYYYFAYYNL